MLPTAVGLLRVIRAVEKDVGAGFSYGSCGAPSGVSFDLEAVSLSGVLERRCMRPIIRCACLPRWGSCFRPCRSNSCRASCRLASITLRQKWSRLGTCAAPCSPDVASCTSLRPVVSTEAEARGVTSLAGAIDQAAKFLCRGADARPRREQEGAPRATRRPATSCIRRRRVCS